MGSGETAGATLPRPTRHRLFIDTADPAAFERWLPTGIVHGVTTNPTVLARAGRRTAIASLAPLAERALGLGAAEFQAQAWGGTASDYERTGLELAAIAPEVVVKVPMGEAGLHAARALLARGVRVTMTAVHDASQVLAAVLLGADYVAPYHGRIGEAGRDADAAIAAMLRIADGAGRTRVLVASVRSATSAAALAAAGCDTMTVSPDVLEAMVARADSAASTAAFEADAARAP